MDSVSKAIAKYSANLVKSLCELVIRCFTAEHNGSVLVSSSRLRLELLDDSSLKPRATRSEQLESLPLWELDFTIFSLTICQYLLLSTFEDNTPSKAMQNSLTTF